MFYALNIYSTAHFCGWSIKNTLNWEFKMSLKNILY